MNLRLSFTILFACFCTNLYSAENSLLEISVPDLEQLRSDFAQHAVGKIILGPDLEACRDYLNQQMTSEAPLLSVIVHHASSIGFKLTKTGDRNNPVGLYLQIDGDFSQVTPATNETIKRQMRIPEASLTITPERITLAKMHNGDTSFAATVADNDLQCTWNTGLLQSLAEETARDREKAQAQALLSFLPDGHMGMRLDAEKFSNYLQLDQTPAGCRPIDMALLKKIPESCKAFIAAGINGQDWWAAHQDAVATLLAREMLRDTSPAAREQALNQANAMATMFLGTDLASFIGAIDGTVLMTLNEPLLVYPNMTVFLPRNEKLDMLVQRLCAMGQQRIPTEGHFEFISFKHPMQNQDITLGAICLACDGQHWILSMDSQLTESYLSGATYDISERHYAERIAVNPEEISFLTVTNVDQGMLVAMQHAIGAAGNAFAEGRFARDLAIAAHRIVKHARPITSIGRIQDGKLIIRNEGAAVFMPGNIAMVAIIASIAIPNLLESRITAHEGAAAGLLKAAVFSSQIQFQAGTYQDADNNGVGEYGFFEWMNGEAACLGAAKGDIGLLTNTGFRSPQGLNGYRYEIWLPDGPKKARNFDDGPSKTPEGIRMSETQYIVYAWPVEPGETGRRAFAMMQDGQLMSVPASELNGEAPVWNAVFGGGDTGWDDERQWPYTNR